VRKVIGVVFIFSLLCAGCVDKKSQSKYIGEVTMQNQSNIHNEKEVPIQKEYKLIRLLPYGKKYCQLFSQEYYETSLKSWKKHFPEYTVETLRENDRKEYDNYKDIDIPLGASRIGGPVVDLPEDIKYPDGYYFMAQLNCKELKKYDELNLLPSEGFLYFFVKNYGETGIVLYSHKDTANLKRVVKEHLDWYFSGRLIGGIKSEIETVESRYITEEGEKMWDFFAGTDITKVYGMYTNCQANEEETIKKLNELKRSNSILLLQIGSDFLGEGTQTVYINKNDLQELNFTRCIFEYSQS
jgi:uncharacterized protein YwqG